jgi:diadenylate cyclase
MEMVRRISEEIAAYVVELGVDGRLMALQLDELVTGLGDDRTLVVRDYVEAAREPLSVEEALDNLGTLSSADLLDLAAGARAMGFSVTGDSLDSAVNPRGYRLLSRIPRLPGAIVERLIDHFGTLQALLAADFDDLMAVEGVGESRARAVREGMSRLAESSILERYV